MWQMVSSTTISSDLETGGQVQKLVNPAPLSATERQQVRSALAKVVQPLSLNVQAPSSDLGFLKALAQARVIGVGEGSHGTHEHFLLKARIFKVLAQQYGFTALAFESNMAGGEAVNAYISGPSDDLGAAVAGLGFVVWRNEDIRDLLVWMRNYNAGRVNKVPLKFVAIDINNGSDSF